MKPRLPPPAGPLLNAIYEALVAEPRADGVRVSIEALGRPMAGNNGTVAMMKSLCWNVTSGGAYIGEAKAVLAVVHAEHTEVSIRADLELHFDGYQCIVDNDIWIDVDE